MGTHQEHLAQPLSTPPPRMDECIKHCEHCHRQCLKTQTHCTMLGGKHVAPDHLKLLADCVEICRVSADFMVRGRAAGQDDARLRQGMPRVCCYVPRDGQGCDRS